MFHYNAVLFAVPSHVTQGTDRQGMYRMALLAKKPHMSCTGERTSFMTISLLCHYLSPRAQTEKAGAWSCKCGALCNHSQNSLASAGGTPSPCMQSHTPDIQNQCQVAFLLMTEWSAIQPVTALYRPFSHQQEGQLYSTPVLSIWQFTVRKSILFLADKSSQCECDRV